MKDIEEKQETRSEKEKRILDQLYDAYGNLECLLGTLTVIADGFNNAHRQNAVLIFDAVVYYMENNVRDFGETIGEFDLMLLNES